MPSLPFKNNAIRKAMEEPFFQWSSDDDEEADEKVVQEPRVLTRDEVENGKLIGLH